MSGPLDPRDPGHALNKLHFSSTRNASALMSLFGGRNSPKTRLIISSRRLPAIYLIAILRSNRPLGGSLRVTRLFAVPETFVDFLNGSSSNNSRTCNLAVQFSSSSMDWMRAECMGYRNWPGRSGPIYWPCLLGQIRRILTRRAANRIGLRGSYDSRVGCCDGTARGWPVYWTY
jgi:hypothetical protein